MHAEDNQKILSENVTHPVKLLLSLKTINGYIVTGDVVSFFTPVALGLVTDCTVLIFTWSTHHGVVVTVGPIWTGLMTVSA